MRLTKEEHLGKRLLLRRGVSNLTEVEIIDFSPDEKYVKMRFESGSTTWEPSVNHVVSAELDGGDLTAKRIGGDETTNIYNMRSSRPNHVIRIVEGTTSGGYYCEAEHVKVVDSNDSDL